MKTRSTLIAPVIAAAGLAGTQSSRLRHLPTLCLALLLSAALAPAATVANWQVLFDPNSNNPATSGLTTDSPTFGGATDAMDGIGVAGLFGTTATPASVTLAIDETLTVTATVTLTGGITGGAGYRFSVQNDGGKFVDPSPDNWSGGWNHVLSIAGVGSGIFRARTNGNYMSTASDAVRIQQNPNSTSGTFNGDSTATYLWTMSITRDSEDTVDLFSSFVGGDGNYSEIHNISLDATQTNGLFTYNAVGIQTTSASDLDQLSLSNVQYTVIPEPSAALLGGLGVLCLFRRRR